MKIKSFPSIIKIYSCNFDKTFLHMKKQLLDEKSHIAKQLSYIKKIPVMHIKNMLCEHMVMNLIKILTEAHDFVDIFTKKIIVQDTKWK
jgi:hypothetical protein